MKKTVIYILISLFCNRLTAQTDSKSINIADKTILSFGGRVRNQIESYINEEFQDVPNQNNIWVLQRFFFHSHLKIDNRFEFFAELNSSLQEYKRNPSPVDADHLGISQLFVKYNFKQKWAINIGRKIMRLGTGRLVDVREGPNIRQIFDQMQIDYNSGKLKASVFFSIPVTPQPGVFDNDYLNFNETLLGLYTTSTFSSSINWDAYLFYLKSNDTAYNEMIENNRRASIGIRYFGKWDTFNYNHEFVYQFGKYGNQDIRAWAVFFQIENELNILDHPVNLGLKSAIISGDKKKGDHILNTFNAMYPRGAYFGKVARFGSANLIDIHPYINIQFKKVSVEMDYDFFWRHSTNDGIYNAALILDYPSTNTKRIVAHQPGITIGYIANRYFHFEFESNAIFPGEFLKERNQKDNLYHFVFTTELKF